MVRFRESIEAFFQQSVLFRPGVALIGLGLLIVGLLFKVTAAPFHAWAPDVYQGAPAGVVGFMAAVAKVGAFAALIRIIDVFPFTGETNSMLAAVAAISMVVGTVLWLAHLALGWELFGGPPLAAFVPLPMGLTCAALGLVVYVLVWKTPKAPSGAGTPAHAEE